MDSEETALLAIASVQGLRNLATDCETTFRARPKEVLAFLKRVLPLCHETRFTSVKRAPLIK